MDKYLNDRYLLGLHWQFCKYLNDRYLLGLHRQLSRRGVDCVQELVVQCEPPKDPETYIHRSGRTGRANSNGVSVTLFGRKKEGLIPYIEKKAGLKFERIGAPQPADLDRSTFLDFALAPRASPNLPKPEWRICQKASFE